MNLENLSQQMDNVTNALSGAFDSFQNKLNKKQDIIDASHKLDYALLSGDIPEIPSAVSQLENDLGYITEDAISGKLDTEDYLEDQTEIETSLNNLINMLKPLMPKDYFYIEAVEDSCEVSLKSVPPTSKSYTAEIFYTTDKTTWNSVTFTSRNQTQALPVVLNTGDKVWLAANLDDATLSEDKWTLDFASTKKVKVGGNILSLYHRAMDVEELQSPHALRIKMQNLGANLVEYVGTAKCMTRTYGMFQSCSSLSALPAGFSCPNATDTAGMFSGCPSLSALPDGFSCPNTTNTQDMFNHCSRLSALPAGFSCPNATDTGNMFNWCSSLSALPDGFSCENTTNTEHMFYNCSSLTTFGDNVKIASALTATSNDDTELDKSLITHIGDNFEWFTNATFSGTWDPALGIKNVFPNVQNNPTGWKVYDHYDGE